MKTNSMLAFIFTLLALVMIISLFGWIVYKNIPSINRRPEYCEHFSVDLKPETYSSILEVGQGKLIKVNVTNNGFEDEFRIGVEGPNWVVARPFKIKLEQGQSENIFIYISPTVGSEGNYTFTVFAKSYCGYVETEIKVRV